MSLRILYFSPHPNLSLSAQTGYGTHMREMISAFRQLGHEVDTLIMGGEEQIRSSPEKRSLKVRFKPFVPSIIWNSLRDWQQIRFDQHAFSRLEEMIQINKPDLIYERSGIFSDCGLILARKYGIRHVLEVNAPFVEEHQKLSGRSWLTNLAAQKEKHKMEMADVVTAVSTVLGEFLVEQYQLDPAKLLVTPNAINPDRLAVDPELVEKITVHYQLQEKLVIGFVGSMFPWHGVDLLLGGFAQIAETKPQISLLIVGDGMILSELMDRANSFAFRDRIHFTGGVPHSEVSAYISVMDICVMPNSNWYGSPVKIFEYGALGKAIVAPDNGPLKDVMEEGVDGLLVSPNTDQLTSTLNQLIENPQRRASMGKTFREKVLQSFTWTNMANLVIQKLEDEQS